MVRISFKEPKFVELFTSLFIWRFVLGPFKNGTLSTSSTGDIRLTLYATGSAIFKVTQQVDLVLNVGGSGSYNLIKIDPSYITAFIAITIWLSPKLR